jgi:SAM-dependent methyltransferase
MTDDAGSRFYDEFAAHYHLIFENWEASMTRQAAAISSILQHESGSGRGVNVLDCACGIGTQSLGLAKLGYHVTGSDLSAGAVQRARAEAAARELNVPFYVADVRHLDELPMGGFEVVISMDNALPHLPSDLDLMEAARQMRAKLRPGGTLLASIRDYDQLIGERPTVQRVTFLFGLRPATDHLPGLGLGGRATVYVSSLDHPRNACRVEYFPRRVRLPGDAARGNHSDSCVEWLRKYPLAAPARMRILPAGSSRHRDRLISGTPESTWSYRRHGSLDFGVQKPSGESLMYLGSAAQSDRIFRKRGTGANLHACLRRVRSEMQRVVSEYRDSRPWGPRVGQR